MASCIWKVLLLLTLRCASERLRGQFQESGSSFANLKIKQVKKAKVDRISKAEAIRLRQTGLRFHEVEHLHFSDDNSRNGKLWKDLKDAASQGTSATSEMETESNGFPWRKKRERTGDDDDEEEHKKRVKSLKKDEAKGAPATNTSELDTSLTEALMPQKTIKPTRIGGFLCAQFDLDLFALSGGTFPGMVGIGLLGDIHYQPSTKCFGWTAEIYLMLSIGVGLWGMDFRVALVVIATLVVTERPLSAGAKDLVWELPPGFDTAHCMQSNPFALVTATTREGWSFVYNHVLRGKYLKHPENEVQKYLTENKHEMTSFQRYVDLIEPPQALPETITSSTQSRGLASTGIVGSVEIRGRWLQEGGLDLEVIMPRDARVNSGGVHGNIFQYVSEVRAKIWQDIGQVILSQKSGLCDWPKYKNYRCKFTLPARRNSMAYVQLTFRTFQDFVAPIQIDRSDETFSFPASVRASVEAPAGTLSCQMLNAARSNAMCAAVDSVKLKAEVGYISEEATWEHSEFGEGHPWGISIPMDRYQGDHREIDELLAEKNGNQDAVANIRLYEMSNEASLHFLSSLVKANSNWCPEQESFRHDLWLSLAKPTKKAGKTLHPEVLRKVVGHLVEHMQSYFRKQMENQSDVFVAHALSNSIKVSDRQLLFLKKMNLWLGVQVKECAKMAVHAAARKQANKAIFLNALHVCRSQGTDATEAALHHLKAVFQSPLKGDKTWKSFQNRTVNTRSCSQEGFLTAESAARCRQYCDEFENERQQCNTVVFEEAGETVGWCTLWNCAAWDVFPKDESKELSIKLEEQAQPTDMEVFVSAPLSVLPKALSRMSDLEDYLEDLIVDEESIKIWSWEVRRVWPDRNQWPADPSYILNDGIFRPLLASCLLKEGGWIGGGRTRKLLNGLGDYGSFLTIGVDWSKEKTRFTNFEKLQFANDFKGSSRMWTETVKINYGNEGTPGECSVTIETHWIWQVPGSSAYFVRPNMVPVVQSLFASYDQFVSKLPAYGAQAMQRILPKQSSKWKFTVLPYKTTDGRHLHRHLKKGDQDRVKIYKGEVATDDAVYNFPRAMEESVHREEPNFLYNTGLSVANLFLRVLSDVQAMFNIYFANHPDWDQTCESLPAKFNLFYEMDKARPTSNWKSKLFTSKKSDASIKITHRAKDTVSQRGEELSQDDLAMIEDWHWVGKPRWFFQSEKRAEFFTQTPPAHGKDGWATADVSEFNAVMWPHVWCELVEQEWSSMSTELPQDTGDEVTPVWESHLEDLYQAIPETVMPVIQQFSLDSLGAVVVEMLPGFPDTGCPDRMKSKEEKAVDYATFALLSAWDTSISIMDNSLNFYRWLVEKLVLKEDQLVTEGVPPDSPPSPAAEDVETQASSELSDGKVQVTRTTQLDTIMDTIHMSMEKWRTDGSVRGQGLRNSLMTSWDAMFKNLTEAETSALVEARRSFQESRDTLEALVTVQKARMTEIGDHLEKLEAEIDNVSHGATNATATPPAPEHVALRYVRVLAEAASERQKEVLSHFNRVSSCIDTLAKPASLPKSVFAWTEGFSIGGQPLVDLKSVLKRWSTDKLHNGKGFDLFFEEACRMSPDTDFTIPPDRRLDTLREPRSECERVVLSNAFMMFFPTLLQDIMYTYWNMRVSLTHLAETPKKEIVTRMLRSLHRFLRLLERGAKQFRMDDNFYKAFAYRKDGSLFGNLWSNLPSALTEIAATLQSRRKTRTQWITESIAFRAKLKSARRMRVREQEGEKKTIGTEVEGCICQESWSAYLWSNYLPHLKSFTGCVDNSEELSLKFAKNSSGWKGFCKTKRDPYSATTTRCVSKYAECDPEAESKKPKFQIWRSADVLRADPVRLPLLQLDLYLHVDLRNRRADFCTPNFAPLMLDTNWHWSMSNWLPFDLRRSGCFGARVHPPGVSLQLTLCRHKALAGVNIKHRTTEWSVTGVAYLLSHYNVWGTGDGDMTRDWFGGSGNWGAAAAQQGWPNFLMADPGTWATSEAGSGYLSTSNVAASPSAFWFGLIAEVISAVATVQTFDSGNSTKWTTVKSSVTAAVLVLWRLLQKYAVVPNSWSVFMGTASLLKSLGMRGLTKVTGFRNEHDVVLSLKYAVQNSRRKVELTNLMNDMSMDQLREIFFEAKRCGAKVDSLWTQHTSTAAGSPQVVRNMHRKMLEDMSRSYIMNVKTSHSMFLSDHAAPSKLMDDLFRRCPGRPLWYKVVSKTTPLYTFWKRESSAWVKPRLLVGQEVMLTQYDDDWYTVIDDPLRETHYIPARYIENSLMQLTADVIRSYSAGTEQIPTHALLDFEVEQILQHVSLATLECWGIHISTARPEIFKRIMKKATRYEKDKHPNMFDSTGNLLVGSEVPLGYFSLGYVRNFMSDNFGEMLSAMNSSQKADFLSIFQRGKGSRVGFSAKKQQEILTSKTSYYDVGLSLLTRLGFSFIKLPGVFQLQPYLQLSIQYDVKEIFRMFQAKVRSKDSDKVQKYLRRKAACERCVEMNLAFCDRQEAADAMLKDGHTAEMDACEVMDEEGKESCHRFTLPEWSEVILRGAGVFKKEVCPCYRPVSGIQIIPRWITNKESCADISWPDEEVEALKRASKDRDWQSGFSMQNHDNDRRFSLDQINDINILPPQQQECIEGFRCCGVFQKDADKPSKVRCVNARALRRKSSWIHPASKCKYFKPKDSGETWSHAENHCSANAVDGYWSWSTEAKEWQRDTSPEASKFPVDQADALALQDDTDPTDDELV